MATWACATASIDRMSIGAGPGGRISTAFAVPTTFLTWDGARERAHAAALPLPVRSVPIADADGA
ncbi:MAG: hypothetical protein QOI36_3133, partial [Pseudonocardiales bacterium]|nr:hypothetical protein [Pseudonocardiales bacterium]